MRLKAVVIGGSALALINIINRPTRDFDILHPDLSDEILAAAHEFASIMREQGVELADDWLNNDPQPLADILPKDWATRIQPAFKGDALILTTLGRKDLLKTKLFALCDRGTDLSDCLTIQPSAQ